MNNTPTFVFIWQTSFFDLDIFYSVFVVFSTSVWKNYVSQGSNYMIFCQFVPKQRPLCCNV